MQTAHFRSVLPLGHPNVDRENGVIRDVSIITEGPARGHVWTEGKYEGWPVFADATTLQQVKACAESRGAGGIAAKFNPLTFDHGPAGIAGFFGEWRIEGDQLLANLFLEPEFPARNYLLNLADRQSGSFGLSVDFEIYGEPGKDKVFARCATLDAVTVVDVPAANSKGLFRVGAKNDPVDGARGKSQTPLELFGARRPDLSIKLFSSKR